MTTATSPFTCRCGRVIGHLLPHPKYPDINVLNLGNLNIAENFHGRCAACGAGIHFDWRWELAARAFGSSASGLVFYDEDESNG